MSQDVARVYQQCNPAKPLQPGDSRYVPCEDVRGTGDLVMRLANAIRLSDSPLHLLFTGHRGGGKSTELLRLKDQLSNPVPDTDRFFVVYFEAEDQDVDVNDVDFPDVLLAMIRQVGKALREQAGVELRPTWIVRFLDDLKDLLGREVEFEKLDWDVKIAKFTAAIKSSPDARRDIRKALEPNISNLIQAANLLLDEAATHLKHKGYRDLVIIVDDLDRIVLRNVPDSDFNTHEQLFINRGSQLAQVGCHVVYTLPISMVFSPKAPALANIFSRRAETLPMVKIVDRNGRDFSDGLEAMRTVASKRVERAGVPMADAFDSVDTLDYLCRMSGGHVRNLLILMRTACEWSGSLPIVLATAQEVVQQMSGDFERGLNRPEFYDVLRQVDQSHELPGTEQASLLLYNNSVLEYQDSYAVNPAVRLLSKFARPNNAKTRGKR